VDLRVIEKRAVGLTLLLLIATIPFRSPRVSLGVLVGSLVAALNYWWLKSFVTGIFDGPRTKIGKLRIILYTAKYLITAFVIFFTLKYGMINVIALVAGLTVVTAAIFFEGVSMTRTTRKEGAE
jgi:small-conductance mechanosensitive channel